MSKIFESPDGGKTVYQRDFGTNPQTRVLLESCVLCGKITSVAKDLHIDLREGYIEGCGQLCLDCYKKQK
jgi:hypothetical protein